MLTNETEGSRAKCCHYWPDAPSLAESADGMPLSPGRPDSGALQFGGLIIAHVATHVHDSFVERRFLLKLGRACRRITQLQFTQVWGREGQGAKTSKALQGDKVLIDIYIEDILLPPLRWVLLKHTSDSVLIIFC